MDKRFLIYEGFEDDAETIFKEIIKKFNFLVTSKSDSGIFFENKQVTLDVSYETGIQIWIKNKKSNNNVMLFQIAKQKGLEELFFDIIGENFYKDRKGSLEKLSDFLIKHFSKELSETPIC